MGRKPIDSEAMTPAERKRRQRARSDRFDPMIEAEHLLERLEKRWVKDDSPREPDTARGRDAFRDLIACMVFVAQGSTGAAMRNKWGDRMFDPEAALHPMKHVAFAFLPIGDGDSTEEVRLSLTAKVSRTT
jgi:hypothetical protein